MNQTEATKLVAVLKAGYANADVDPEAPDVFAAVLDDLSYEEAMRAAVAHMRQSKYFPTPAEILALARPNEKPMLNATYYKAFEREFNRARAEGRPVRIPARAPAAEALPDRTDGVVA